MSAVVVLAGCGEPPPAPVPAPAPRVEAPKAAPAYRFRDAPYLADAALWKTTGWTVAGAATDADDPGVVFRAAENSGDGNAWRSRLRVSIVASPQIATRDGATASYRYEFRNWGKTVLLSNVTEIATGRYEDWIREGSDIIKARCRASAATASAGPARYTSRAVGTDRTSRVREYRSWFVWDGSAPGEVARTYVAVFVAAADPGKDDDRDAAARELMQSIRFAPGRKRAK